MNKKIKKVEVDGQTLVLSDCISYMQTLPDASVNMIVTSPPYNLGIKYNSYDDKNPREKYLEWIGTVLQEVKRILIPEGSLFLNMGGSCADPWVPLEVAMEARKYLVLQNRISWVKSISIGENSFGHFKPINSERYLNNNFEEIFHFTPTGKTHIDRLSIGVPYTHKSNINRWNGKKDIRCAGNVWFIPYETINSRELDRGDHPATFPVELVTRCIKLHGITDGMVVMDPFLGSGSTLIATKKLAINGVGVELDDKYIKYAMERIKNHD